MAVVDFFLMPNGIKGESTDSQHSGAIELDSCYWGCTNTSTVASSGTVGGGAGKVKAGDLHFRSKPSVASPLLFQYCANGTPIDKVMLYARKQGGTQWDYLTITLENVYVSSHRIDLGFDVELGAGGAEFSIEAGSEVSDNWVTWEYGSMSYGKLTFQYNQQQTGGGQGAATIKFFDFTTNKGG
jgi:type VI secretion system secreted protein Hcp